ncbi:hypothetical protein ACW23B_01305 [Streptomyces albidoflavus]
MTGELSERDLERMSRSGAPRSPSNRAWPSSTPPSSCPGAVLPVRLDLAALRGRGEVRRSCAVWSAPAPAARCAPV